MLLRHDLWEGSLNKGGEQDEATLDSVDAAIRALDGWTRTQVSLEAQDGTILAIGGGRELFLVQYLLPEDGGEWLPDDADKQGEVELAIGRQAAPYPRRNLVGIDQALEAAHCFFLREERAPELAWSQSY